VIQDAAIIYEGESNFPSREPITVIATGIKRKSKNAKTGAMVQLWIILQNESPYNASKLGIDGAVCGDCKHRRSNGGACYVDLSKAPHAVYRKYSSGGYEQINNETLNHLKNLKVRLGAYGDMFAIPYKPLKNFLSYVGKHTGYTHAWQNLDNKSIDLARKYFVASVDSGKELSKARKLGLSTFRVKALNDNNNISNEIECVNTTHNKSCADCMLCSGRPSEKTRPRNIYINVHGSRAKAFTV